MAKRLLPPDLDPLQVIKDYGLTMRSSSPNLHVPVGEDYIEVFDFEDWQDGINLPA